MEAGDSKDEGGWKPVISRRREVLYLFAEVPLQNRYRATVTGEGEPVPSRETSADPETLKSTNGK